MSTRSKHVERVSEEFLDAVLREESFYGPLIKAMARELRERRDAVIAVPVYAAGFIVGPEGDAVVYEQRFQP